MNSQALTCKEAKQRVHDAIDQEMHDAVLESHLSVCTACREYATDIRCVAACLDDLKDESEAIVARPARRRRSAGRTAKNGRQTTGRLWKPLRIAAAIALLVAGSIYVLPEWRASRQNDGIPQGAASVRLANKAEVTIGTSPNLGMTLRGKAATNLLAVAQDTDEENVRMYRLYRIHDPKTAVE